MPASQIFHTAGRRHVWQVWNGATARPTTLYVGLRKLDGAGGAPADAAAADTLTSNLSEVSGVGYARQSVTFNNANCPESLSGADSLITFPQVTFTFTGTFSGITHAFVATTSDNTGTLIESAPLSVTRNVANGDTLKVTFQSILTQG
jgi:hypothetical protein